MKNIHSHLNIFLLLGLTFITPVTCLGAEQDHTQLLPSELYLHNHNSILSKLSPTELLDVRSSDVRFQNLATQEMAIRLRTRLDTPDVAFESPENTVYYFKERFLFDNQGARESLQRDICIPQFLRGPVKAQNFGTIIFYAAKGSMENLKFLMALSEENNFALLLQNSIRLGVFGTMQTLEDHQNNSSISKTVKNNLLLLNQTITSWIQTGTFNHYGDVNAKLLTLQGKITPFTPKAIN